MQRNPWPSYTDCGVTFSIKNTANEYKYGMNEYRVSTNGKRNHISILLVRSQTNNLEGKANIRTHEFLELNPPMLPKGSRHIALHHTSHIPKELGEHESYEHRFLSYPRIIKNGVKNPLVLIDLGLV